MTNQCHRSARVDTYKTNRYDSRLAKDRNQSERIRLITKATGKQGKENLKWNYADHNRDSQWNSKLLMGSKKK